MATTGSQDPWPPYDTTKDCSNGVCSFYCPQWCYIFFPPPPQFSENQNSSNRSLSPLMITMIGILGSAFLLISYYIIISKYCGSFNVFHWRLQYQSREFEDEQEDDPSGASQRHETWNASQSNGLDETLINKIAVWRYKRSDGLVADPNCSVCLSEFQEDESLRLLPKCSHAFHIQCIDTWLKSHSSCPLCRANIVSVGPATIQLPALPVLPDASPIANNEAVVVIVEGSSRREGENELGNDAHATKDSSMLPYDIVEVVDDGIQAIRPSFLTGIPHRMPVSMAKVVSLSLKDEFMAEKRHGLLTVTAAAQRCHGEKSRGKNWSRGLHCVISTTPMKRSFSGLQLCFTRHWRGRSSLLARLDNQLLQVLFSMQLFEEERDFTKFRQ